jgi:DNA (cytosine-5)-methyltransferase 1
VSGVVLSLFPGIGILDKAFEEEGFCVVRGPDLLWGGDIKRFHAPAGRFDGVIGGSPCQAFSRLIHIIRHNGYKEGENLIPEFERVCLEAQPAWFVMENVQGAPLPVVAGYQVDPALLDNRWIGGVQSRRHRFSFGTRDGRRLHFDTAALENADWDFRVCASDYKRGAPIKLASGGKLKANRPGALSMRHGRSIARACELQGLPRNFFDHSPFTKKGQGTMLGNAVPFPMCKVLARAVLEATGPQGAFEL